MPQPLVVGVKHDPDYRLLDRKCRKRFAKEILPFIDRDTLLLIEGAYRESYYREEDPLYHIRREEAERHIGTTISCPTIGWCDERWKMEQGVGSVRELFEVVRYERHNITPFITLPADTPATFAELCNAFVHVHVNYVISGKPSGLEKYCFDVLKQNAQFDKPTIKAARTWSEDGGRVIILCGALHALTIHRDTRWPTTFLADIPENVRELTRDLVATVLYPEKILGKNS